MDFRYSAIDHNWRADGKGDRIYTITVTPNGYFTAEGDHHKRCCRTHFEAAAVCETWEAQAQANDESIWAEAKEVASV